MPQNLLQSYPVTGGGFEGKALCLAMGVLGRNKGSTLERLSANWSKGQPGHPVRRSTEKQLQRGNGSSIRYNQHCIRRRRCRVGTYYGRLLSSGSTRMVSERNGAAIMQVELQSARGGEYVTARNNEKPTPKEMNALYRASYVSMIISLNYITYPRRGRAVSDTHLCRPDLHGMALLLMAEGASMPIWRQRPLVAARLKEENDSFEEGSTGSWRKSMAWLLGLGGCPSDEDLLKWVFKNAKAPRQSQDNTSNSLVKTDSAVVVPPATTWSSSSKTESKSPGGN
ncbi:hypothetical protein BDD12DRAFT_805564 [Trichophaea hybrida]|nr:hypothetical protein BDD12DRAFT_805564 [Trichophaea hybrida]